MNNGPRAYGYYATQSVEKIIEYCATDSDAGLSNDTVLARQKQYGLNILQSNAVAWYILLLRQFTSPFIYILLIVAIVSLLARQGSEPLIVIGLVVFNALIGFYQEYHANHTVAMLQRYITFSVPTLRAYTVAAINSSDLVPGDIVVLSAGMIIPADVRFIEAHNVFVDESTLTGEAELIAKTAQPLEKIPGNYSAAYNIGFAGTLLMQGDARAVVYATGNATVLGSIAQLTSQVHESAFSHDIRTISNFIIRIVLVCLIILLCVMYAVKGSINIFELLLFVSALAVSVIPVALPLVITFALANGALHLAQKKMVVKRLSAIEDLGNIQILCTDKTGTLTENVMTVSDVCGSDPDTILQWGALVGFAASDGAVSSKGFTFALLQKLPSDRAVALRAYRKYAHQSFDPVTRSEAVVVSDGTALQLVVIGAPERVLPRCAGTPTDAMNTWQHEQAVQGKRIVAIARGHVADDADVHAVLRTQKQLTLLGFVSFIDPLKNSSRAALKKAQGLGITIKILSGDTKQVCAAVAQQVGLITDDSQVMTGEEFAALSGEQKAKAVMTHHVFARVMPEQKYDIITLLEKEHTVGYLGDGINDAAALKKAHVGLAVRDSAQVACQAADIILLGKSLHVIIEGIAQGRRVFANTYKYIKITLAANLGNFFTMASASLVLSYLPMLPAQILLLNVVSDFPLVAIATDSVSPAELRRPEAYDTHRLIVLTSILGLVCTVIDFIFFALFSLYWPTMLQTSWFLYSLLAELVLIVCIRTRERWYLPPWPSKSLLGLSCAAAAAGVWLVHSAIGQRLFLFSPIGAAQYGVIVVMAVVYFCASETIKRWYYRWYGKKSVKSAVQ